MHCARTTVVTWLCPLWRRVHLTLLAHWNDRGMTGHRLQHSVESTAE